MPPRKSLNPREYRIVSMHERSLGIDFDREFPPETEKRRSAMRKIRDAVDEVMYRMVEESQADKEAARKKDEERRGRERAAQPAQAPPPPAPSRSGPNRAPGWRTRAE